ncbi:hypothetical protein [Sinorhizobium sojae]|uniref:hypothetical protein n=1 Tax=Sinorhizobium sojae TaxID=716925 RepID=UPI0012F717D9|nr:hypothetical protein [Sinorhizobium sojae]
MRYFDSLTYDEILERHEQEVTRIKCVYIKRSNPAKGLLVSLATHKNNGRYSSRESYYSCFEGDLLFFADVGNSYYLRDAGAAYLALVEPFVRHCRSSDMIYGHLEDAEQKYYIPGIDEFVGYPSSIKSHRYSMERGRQKFPFSRATANREAEPVPHSCR